MKEKLKSLSLTKAKISEAEHEGKTERRVTFVASTANEDRDYEIVQIDSFRLPLKGGGHIAVSELPATGADNIDIPLLTNHDLWDVSKAIGSVRQAFFQDGRLIFEAGISSREYAQDIFKLIEEGHLDNAFSIRYRDYNHDTAKNVDTGGEIIEVSVVTRGSNKDAQVLGVKALKGENMEDDESAKTADTPEEQKPTETPEHTMDELKDETSESSEGSKQEENKSDEENTSEDVNNSSDNEKEKTMNDLPDHNGVAAKQVKLPSQAATSSHSVTGKEYLKSKQAEKDFARHIHDNYGQKSAMVLKSWAEKVKEKGVTGDEILPSRLENIFFKAWDDLTSPLSTFYRLSNLRGSLNAWTTEDTAKRHKKGGADKVSQNVANTRRDYKAVMIYKMLEIDLEDLIFDEGGELTLLRNEELTERINGQIVKAAIVGDGLETTDDGALFDGTRGIWSIKYDLDNSTTKNTYSAIVASVINSTTNPAANMYEKITQTLAAVKGGEGEKITFVPEGTLAELTLLKNENGGYLFQPGTNFDQIFKTRIFEADFMTDSGYDVIAYRSGKYALPMGDMMVRTGFDLKTNKDAMLQERMVAGSLFGGKVAAGYASK